MPIRSATDRLRLKGVFLLLTPLSMSSKGQSITTLTTQPVRQLVHPLHRHPIHRLTTRSEVEAVAAAVVPVGTRTSYPISSREQVLHRRQHHLQHQTSCSPLCPVLIHRHQLHCSSWTLLRQYFPLHHLLLWPSSRICHPLSPLLPLPPHHLPNRVAAHLLTLMGSRLLHQKTLRVTVLIHAPHFPHHLTIASRILKLAPKMLPHQHQL